MTEYMWFTDTTSDSKQAEELAKYLGIRVYHVCYLFLGKDRLGLTTYPMLTKGAERWHNLDAIAKLNEISADMINNQL